MRLNVMAAAAAALIAAVTSAMAAGTAHAGTIYAGSGTNGSGNTISASVDVTIDAVNNKITFVLTNTTPITYAAPELLTAFRFSMSGVTGPVGLLSGTAIGRDVDELGGFSDLGVKNLLSPATWQLGTVGSLYDLCFNPDAEYAILGKPTDGDYADANGSIRDNNGHNPFAYYTAEFVLTFGDVSETASISKMNFRFGTDFAGSITVNVVPLPPALLLGLGMMGAMGAVRGIRRRRRSEF